MKKENLLYIMIILAMVAWGESWISAKIITDYASPDTLTFFRFSITALTFVPAVKLFRERFTLSPAALAYSVAGAAILIVYNRFFFTGLQTGFAGAGGVLVTTLVPLITFVISVPLFGRKILPKDVIGMFFGVLGASILIGVWRGDAEMIFSSGNINFVSAAICWSLLTVVSAFSKRSVTAMTYSFYLFLFAALFDYIFILKGTPVFFKEADVTFWANVWIIAFFATTFGTAVYFLATQELGSEKASSFIFLVPVTALMLSWLILGEKLTADTLLGSALSLVAVYLINAKKPVVKMFIKRVLNKV